MNLAAAPLILDFDDSVMKLSDDERRLPLGDWQERLRFGCRLKQLENFERQVILPDSHGCVFLGSGDYHHMSLLLLKRLETEGRKVDVVVCDNHPDNMRYPFGIHCGSWVFHASRLPSVAHIHVIGIHSADITWRHCWENYLSPLRNGKVTYWSIRRQAGWLNVAGAPKAHRHFESADELMRDFLPCLGESRSVYLSVDKDVFSEEVVKTNWDQGSFEFRHVEQLISVCGGKLAGVDVTGEISGFRYKGLFKRTLAGLDGLEIPDSIRLKEWQQKQSEFNKHFLGLLRDRK